MIDFNSASDDELREYGKKLGLRFGPNSSRERMLERIRDAESDSDEVQKNDVAEPLSSRVIIEIHKTSDKNETDPVFVGVNGRGYAIKRGVPVSVPREVVGVLENAVQDNYEVVKDEYGKKHLNVRQSLAYPFSIKSR